MYKFNRFYLLGSLILSYVIPFITITLPSQEKATKPQLIIEATTQQIASIQTGPAEFNWMNVLWAIYGSISIFLLIKSTLAIFAIKKIQGEKITYQNCNVILTKEDLPPFSFWNTVYMGKKYIKNNFIDPRIFLHEKNHIDQKHSIDIMLIDLLKIFTWINPALFFFKKAVITNHEFLADEAVLNGKFNIKEYQNLILDEIINRQNLPLTHSFNFINTKKRFIMMNTKKTKFDLLKKTVGITAMITSVALFSEKSYANETIRTVTGHADSKLPEVSTIQQEISPASPITNTVQPEASKEVPATLPEFKKEKLKTTQDTIAPKAQKENNEGNNTNVSTNSEVNQNRTQPEFPGGTRVLREKIGKNMDTTVLTPQKGTLKSVAYIHIDATGKTTDIKISGDNEAFNKEFLKTVTAISEETTWKPATENGKAIAAVLKLPATMSFGQ
ncbi:M56 family metallopeptidase [Chryseobacterium phosphatilyticum]|nr:M56 family metallopeptidase [Chryseobacterium phosphatilyticum]